MDDVTVPAGDTAPVEGLGNEQPIEGAEQQVATPQFYTVKVDGRELQVTQDELLNGYQRQAHFTQETQKLAAERQRLAQAEAVWSAIQDDPATAIEQLQQHFAETLQANQPLEPEDKFKREVESFIKEQREREALAGVNAELGRLQQQFGQFDHDALLQHALDYQIPSLEVALIHMNATNPQVQAQQQRAAADAAALAAKQGLPPVSGGSHTAAGTSRAGGKPITSVKDALSEALAEAGLSSLPTPA